MSPEELPGKSQATGGQCRAFTLLGGPLYRLGCRLGLVRNGSNTVPLGLAIGTFLWVVLVVLALAGGVGGSLFSLTLIGGHVRLLLVIPLMFVCETAVDPRMAGFPRALLARGIVTGPDIAALDLTIARIFRLKDSWLVEAAFLALALLMTFTGAGLDQAGNTGEFVPGKVAGPGTWVAWWYGAVCLMVFRFLFLRMLWTVLLWAYLLWRVSRLELRLMPSHPDVAGGLGLLEIIQMHFLPLVLGFSMLRSAQFAEEISSGTMTFDGIYPGIMVVLLLDAILFIAPLLVFSLKLWQCRVSGMSQYMGMAARYVRGFDRKWLQQTTPDEPLLGTPDIQSLADLSNSVDIVRRMRWAPFGSRLVTSMGMAVLLPMFPLLLLKFPITELARKLVTGLVGL